MGVSIVYRGYEVLINGQEHAVSAAANVFERMDQRLEERGSLCETDVKELIEQVKNLVQPLETEPIVVYSHKAVIEPHTKGQLRYIEAMRKNDLTFCTGPAGTGKAFLAVESSS